MSKATSSKAGNTTVNPDAISSELVTEYQITAATGEQGAISLLCRFAARMAEGSLSVNGAKATLEAAAAKAKADGLTVISALKAGQVQHWQAMAFLSMLSDAPAKVSALYTLADHMARSAKAGNGESKADATRRIASAAVDGGRTFAAVRKATPKPKAKQPKADGGKVKTTALTVDTVKALADLVSKAGQAEAISEELGEALAELYSVIEIWL